MFRKYLRTIAIALIIFPEPVTTALGLALLSATFAVTDNKRSAKFGNMEELAKKSLKIQDPREFGRYRPREESTVVHGLNIYLPAKQIIVQNGLDNSLERTRSDIQMHNWFDNHKVSEKVLHHTLKTSFPQYEAMSDVLHQTSGLRLTGKESAQTAVRHTLNTNWAPQISGQENGIGYKQVKKTVISEKVVHHVLKASLVPDINMNILP